MSQYPDSEIPQPRLRTMQIIAAAMIIGPLVALAIFAVVRPNMQHPAAAELPIVTYVGVAFAAIACISQFIVPRLLGTAAAARITGQRESATDQDESGWLGVYQTCMIVGMAALEGATFLLGIAYLLEGQLLALAAAGLLVLGLILQFPTRNRIERWIQKQKDNYPPEGALP